MEYTIKEAAGLLAVPATTLRYYEKEGLLPFVERKSSGYRVFSDDDISMMRVIECLKKTGMPIKDIRQFSEWVRQGDASLQERYDMFCERHEAALRQLEEMKETIALIERKCEYYRKALEAGTEPDQCIPKEGPMPCEVAE